MQALRIERVFFLLTAGGTLTKNTVCFASLPPPEATNRLSFHELLECSQHHFPILFGMLTGLLGQVVVLRSETCV